MNTTQRKAVTRSVMRRAQRQGSVTPQEIGEELKRAGLPKTRWKDVVAEARTLLTFRDGEYHYVAPDPGVEEGQRQQQAIRRAVRQLVRRNRQSADHQDRRREGRVDFIQPVTVQADGGRLFTLLCRDLSPTGIRLIGSRSFLGQRVRVTLSAGEGEESVSFWVRVLWTCTVGDQLFENGGTFLEVASPEQTEADAPLDLAGAFA